MASTEKEYQRSTAKTDPKLVVVCIPAVNEERTIAKVVIGSQQFAREVIVCDDGSTDMTATIAERLGARVIRHERNMGKGEAMRSLFLAARQLDADVMVTLDGDGQHYSNEIPSLIEPIIEGVADVAVGSRFLGTEEIPAYRKAGNKILNVLTANELTDTQSGFRAYSRRAIQNILPAEMGMGVDSEIIMEALKTGLKVSEVPVSVSYSEEKTSTHNPVFHTLDVIFSVIKLTSIRHPLIFYGMPGLGLIAAGVYFALRALEVFGQQGLITNTTMVYGIASLGLAMLGLQILFTGIILFTLVTVVRKKV